MMRYFDKIDGLRFIAIIFVLIEHFAPDIGTHISAGYYGVDLFFVISGFLITNILLKADGSILKSYKNFVGRRTLRIFPIYYLTILMLVVLGYEPANYYLVYYISYTFNYAWIHLNIPANSLTHFWSLAVEEQFYLIWPFLILPLRNYTKTLFVIISIIIVICFLQLTIRYSEEINPYNYVGLFPRAGSLCIGAIGALLYKNKRIPAIIFESKAIELFIFTVLIISLTTKYTSKEIVLALCSLYLVLKAVHSDFNFEFINKMLTHKKALFVGRISYGIYVYHLPISYYLVSLVITPFWTSFDFYELGKFSFMQNYMWVVLLPLLGGISIGVAYLSNIYIEKPILKLKDKYFK